MLGLKENLMTRRVDKKRKGSRGYAKWHRISESFDLVKPHNKDLITAFLKYKTKKLSPETLNAYSYWLKAFFSWNYKNNSDKSFEEIKMSEFSEYFDYLFSLELSSARINTMKSVLSSMSEVVELLYEDEFPTFRNRVKHIDIPTNKRVLEKTIISETKLNKMLNTLADKDEEAACYLSLLANSGCRKSEAAQMRTSWFSKNSTAFKGYVYETGVLRSKGRGISGKPIRKYIIRNSFKPFLDKWLKKRKELGISGDFLFRSKSSNMPTTRDMDIIVSRIKAINRDFYSHCMRHYFCTKLKQRGILDDQIRDIFSWENVSIIKIYDDTSSKNRLTKAFTKLSKLDNK